MKRVRKTLKIMEMHFFTLNNDIFSGQQVWATFVEIGSPYPAAPPKDEATSPNGGLGARF